MIHLGLLFEEALRVDGTGGLATNGVEELVDVEEVAVIEGDLISVLVEGVRRG